MRRIATAVLLGGMWLVPVPAHAQTELIGSIWFPDTHPLTKYGYLDWSKQVEAASKGQLKIKVFTGTALLPPNAHLSGLRDGFMPAPGPQTASLPASGRSRTWAP